MSADMTKALLKRAVILFPRSDYTNPSAVRHARRKWLQAITSLRANGRWILDQPVRRKESM
jgi:hypothetical protein